MTTSVMKFGVRAVIEHEDVALDEMRDAHRYYNDVMTVRLEQRVAFRELRERHVPGITEAEEDLDRIQDEIGSVYESIGARRKQESAPKGEKAARPRKLDATDSDREKLATLKEEQKLARARVAELRKAFSELVAPGHVAFDERTSGAPRKLLDQIAEVGSQLKEAKKTKGNPDVARLKAAHDELKRRKKQISPATFKKAAANARVLAEMLDEDEWCDAWKDLKRLDAEMHTKLLALRDTSGLTHGTYTAVEAAVDQACKTAKTDPRRRPWWMAAPGRKIGRQIQEGKRPMTGKALYAGGDSRLRIVSREPLRGRRDQDKGAQRGATSQRNHWEYVVFAAPIGKGSEKKTIQFEALLHRRIPDDAVITWWYLVPRDRKLTLQLTVNTQKPLIDRGVGVGECRVRLRWSRDEESGGIVVADCNDEQVILDGPEYQDRARNFTKRGGAIAGMMFARSIRSARDRYFEDAKQHVSDWVNEHEEKPEWLAECVDRIHKEVDADGRVTKRGRGPVMSWRNRYHMHAVAIAWAENATPGREWLAPLWREWRTQRKAADLNLYCEPSELAEWLGDTVENDWQRMGVWLDWWRRKDLHMDEMARNIDRKARGNRLDQYRRKARELAGRFESVAVDVHDLSATARRKKPGEDDDELTQKARWQRTVAAPSEFRAALKLAFGPGRYREKKRERSGDAEKTGTSRKRGSGMKGSASQNDRADAAA